MFKRQFLMIVAFLFLLAPFVYSSPERVNHVDVGIGVGGAIPKDSDINSATQVSGNIAYGITEWFAVGFSGGWQNFGSDDTTGSGVTIIGPDITGIPLFGDLIFRVPTGQEPFTPYGVVGLGVVVWDVDDTTATFSGIPSSVKTDVSTEFAVKLGGGIDWFLNDHWIVNFEGSYVFNDPDSTSTLTIPGVGTFTSDLDIDSNYWTLGGGVKYRF